jgi:hypothetical protein
VTLAPDDEQERSARLLLRDESSFSGSVLVIGDVVGHGLPAGGRAAFVRVTFAAAAPFFDDSCCLLSVRTPR